MAEVNRRVELPTWIYQSVVQGVLVVGVLVWLGSMVSEDYEPVKNLRISMGMVAGNQVSCVQAAPIDAIMATAWNKTRSWDLSLLGEQYFVMNPTGQVEAVWSKDATLSHLVIPEYNDGDSICVIYSRKK